MSKEEWLKLQLGQYIHHDNGWGGYLTSAPAPEAKWNEEQTLSFENHVKDYNLHRPDHAKASEHDKWHVLKVSESINSLAVAIFTLNELYRFQKHLAERTIL